MLRYHRNRRPEGLWMAEVWALHGEFLPASASLFARSALAVPLIAAACLTGHAGAQCQYEVTIIHAPICGGGFAEVPTTSPTDISETGVVVGQYGQCSDITLNEAFLWSEQTGFVTLPRPAGFYSIRARGVSADGQIIVGWGFSTQHDRYLTVVWEKDGTVLIEPIGDSLGLYAENVSDAFAIVGSMNDPTPKSDYLVAFRLNEGNVEALSTPHSFRGSANDLTGDAIAAGFTGRTVTTDSLPAIWTATSSHILDTTDLNTAKADCINESQVVGGAGYLENPEPGTLTRRPVVWTNGTLALLPIMSGAIAGHVLDISDSAVASGSNLIGGEGGRATMWIDGQLVDLNNHIDDSRVYRLLNANAINSDGWIACQANVFVGELTAVATALLKPIGSAPGDLNRDCTVNVLDLEILLEQWNRNDTFADINQSGNVDVFDLFLLLSSWG